MAVMATVGHITLLLREADAGREGALDELMTLVYDDLERLAHSYLRKHFGDRAQAITLEPAALVNESFLKLIKQRNRYDNSGHFFAIASRVMLRVLIDYRRQRAAAMRGGDRAKITLMLDEQPAAGRDPQSVAIEVERLSDALEKLDALNRRKADVVKMRVIWGLDLEQIAQALDVSIATVSRDWRFSKAWLYEAVCPSDGPA